jgi:hypothetical protein
MNISGNLGTQRFGTNTTTLYAVASTITSMDMPLDFMETRVYFEFSDLATFATLVTPTAGTVTVTATENGTTYGSVFMGTNMSVATADYQRLTIAGQVKNVKAVPTGITGATYWRMIIVRN